MVKNNNNNKKDRNNNNKPYMPDYPWCNKSQWILKYKMLKRDLQIKDGHKSEIYR